MTHLICMDQWLTGFQRLEDANSFSVFIKAKQVLLFFSPLPLDVDARCGHRRVAIVSPPDLLHQLKGGHAVQLGEGTHHRHLLIHIKLAQARHHYRTISTTCVSTTDSFLSNSAWRYPAGYARPFNYDSVFVDSLGWDVMWRLEWTRRIRTLQGQKALVRHQRALSVDRLFLFFFICSPFTLSRNVLFIVSWDAH